MAHLLLPLSSSPATTTAWLTSYLPSLLFSGTILFVLVAVALHYLLPLTLRTWFLPRDFKIGHFSLSAVHHLAWEPEPGSRLAGIKVTVGSVGFVRWRGGGRGGGGGIKEGLRNAGRKMMKATDRDKDRAWFLLRCQDVRVSITQEALERLLSSSSSSTTTTTTTGDDDDTHDTEHDTEKTATTTPPPPLSKRARLPAHPPPPSALLPLFPQLAPKWQRLLVYFAVQLSFLVQVEHVADIEGTVCAGAEIAHHQLRRGRRRSGSAGRSREDGGDDEAEQEEAGGGGAEEPEAKAWMRLSRIKIAAARGSSTGSSTGADTTSPSPSPSPDRSSLSDDTTQPAAVEMLDPLVIRVAAPLVAVPSPPLPPPAQPESAAATTSSSSSSPPPPPPPRPVPATSPRWSLRRGGVRVAIEFGGEGGPSLAAGRGGGAGDSETLLVGLAAQAAAAAAEKKEQARRRRQEEDEKRVRGGGGAGLGRVARTVDAGVHVRVQELDAIVTRLKDAAAAAAGGAVKARDGFTPGGSGPRRHKEGGKQPAEEPPRDAATAEKSRQRPSPLVFLDSISFELPSFLVTAQHTIPSAVLSSDSDSDSGAAAPSAGEAASPLPDPANHPHHLPKEIAFAVLVRDVKAHVEINRSTRDVRKEHRDWFGRERQISWRIGAEWREIEGRVKLDGGEGASRASLFRRGIASKSLPRDYLLIRSGDVD